MNLYKKMHTEQTFETKIELKKKFKYNKLFYVNDIIPYLNKVIDTSDPDTDFPQIYHGYQTAESIRNNFMINNDKLKDININSLFTEKQWNLLPKNIKKLYSTSISNLYKHITDWSWFPLVGLIHDLGKILVLDNFYNMSEHFSVGDIYPLGCKFSSSNIFYKNNFYKNSNDYKNKLYTTILGKYTQNCGFDNLEMTFSHDFYFSEVLNHSQHNLHPYAIYIIKFHSFYPWHTSINQTFGYSYFASYKDWYLLPLLKLFQKSDLYSKNIHFPNIKELQLYYNTLINKFLPHKLYF